MNLSPTQGPEQRGDRSAFVFPDTRFNEGPAGLTVFVPLTTTHRPGIPTPVEATPEQPGLNRCSFIMCEQLWATLKDRLRSRIGRVHDQAVLQIVEDRVRLLLGLYYPPSGRF